MVELLMAMAVMVIIGGVVAGLASAVQTSNEYAQGVAAATQHGRVALERIAQTVRTATASEDFPGCAVVDVTIDGYHAADTLVVWHPAVAPANPAGPPLACELVIYGPDPTDPRTLAEITPASGDTRSMPLPTADYAGWVAFIDGLMRSASSTKTTLTDLLRAASVASGSSGPPPAGPETRLRGAAHFECRVAPSAADWASYRSGTLAWGSLAWPQGLYGSQAGVRQIHVDVELQLMPRATPAGQASAGDLAVAILGSATLNYGLSK
jgi:hypothetical protein